MPSRPVIDRAPGSAISARLLRSLPMANQLGEGVLWQPDSGCVWWTDILASRLFRYQLDSDRLETIALPERLACFGFEADTDWLICAFASGFARFHPTSGELQWLRRLPDTVELRLNDGRVDRAGRFWAGTMVENECNDSDLPHKLGQLYCCEPGGAVTSRLTGIRISNGLCWSPDGRTQYFADSPRQEIYAFDADPDTGALGNRRLFARTEPGHYPDGATVDAEGRLWSAQWGSGQVLCYSPSGQVLARVQLPASQVSCVAFGGPDLDLLLVTSAACDLTPEQRAREPQAGNLFICQTNVTGLPEPRYRA